LDGLLSLRVFVDCLFLILLQSVIHCMPCPCRSLAVPLPCRALIHTCHAAPLPCSDSAVSFVKVCVVAGNIRTASPIVKQIVLFAVCCYHSLQSQVWIVVRRIGMLLITIFVELRVVAGRSRTWAGNSQASLSTAVLCRGLEKNGMVRA